MISSKQNGNIIVEAIQMLTSNVQDILKFLDNPNAEVVKTKLSYKNLEIVTVMISCYNSKTPLRHKDFLVKYTEGRDKKISFVVMSEEQYHQRYMASSDTEKTDYYNGRISPWGY
jgi:isocitrate dehydrogenase